MPAEPTALSTVPPSEPPADTDYDAICAAVTATARGRWFLDEFAKRNRNTDTTEVLAAIARMEAAVVGERAQQASREAHQEVRIELLEMARTIAQARAEVAESRPAPTAARRRRIGEHRYRRTSPAPPSGCGRSHGRCGPAASSFPRPIRSDRSRRRSCRPMRCAAWANNARRNSPRRCSISSIASTGCSTAIARPRAARGRACGGSRPAGGESPRSRPAAGDHGGGDDRRRDARERRTDGRGRAGVLARCGNDARGRQPYPPHPTSPNIRWTTTWC